MIVLALDPATKTGWAHSCGASGVWDLSVRTDESKGMRLIRLRAKLREIHDAEGIELMAFEAARNTTQGRAVIVQSELQGVIKTFCEDNGINYIGLSPSEIKKHATGKGNANKDKMIQAAEARWPAITIEDDNHADALHILDFIERRYPQ